MAECSKEFKDMLSRYKSAVRTEFLLIDDFVADPEPILEYVARLEASHRARITLGYGGLSGAAV